MCTYEVMYLSLDSGRGERCVLRDDAEELVTSLFAGQSVRVRGRQVVDSSRGYVYSLTSSPDLVNAVPDRRRQVEKAALFAILAGGDPDVAILQPLLLLCGSRYGGFLRGGPLTLACHAGISLRSPESSLGVVQGSVSVLRKAGCERKEVVVVVKGT